MYSLVGMARFLDLRPVDHPPGLEFHLEDRKLEIRPRFHLEKKEVIKVPPWAPRTSRFLWTEVEKLKSVKIKDWSAQTNPQSAYAFLKAAQRNSSVCAGDIVVRQAKIELGYRRFGPYLASLVVEFHETTKAVSLIWLEIDIAFSELYRVWHSGEHTTANPISSILGSFADWLASARLDSSNAVDKILGPQIAAAAASQTKDIPLVLAIRGIFLYFVWTGGLKGKFVLQYARNSIYGYRLEHSKEQVKRGALFKKHWKIANQLQPGVDPYSVSFYEKRVAFGSETPRQEYDEIFFHLNIEFLMAFTKIQPSLEASEAESASNSPATVHAAATGPA